VFEEHRDDPGTGCPVAALLGDVGRAGDRVRAGYSALVERYIETLERMLGGGEHSRQQALIAASPLLGSLTLSRAVDDEALSGEILASARDALRQMPRLPRRRVGCGQLRRLTVCVCPLTTDDRLAADAAVATSIE